MTNKYAVIARVEHWAMVEQDNHQRMVIDKPKRIICARNMDLDEAIKHLESVAITAAADPTVNYPPTFTDFGTQLHIETTNTKFNLLIVEE